MNKQLIYFILFLLFLNISCKEKNINNEKFFLKETRISECEVNYAHGFKIEYFPNYKLITINDPWQGARNVQYRYVLADDITLLPEMPEDITVINTPVSKVICLSTTHIAFIDALKMNHTIVGVSGVQFVFNLDIRKAINQNKVVDVGYDNNLNYELITSLKPDLVITYGIGSQVTGYNQKMNELGIKTILNAEYLEEHPLGKLEWIKFIAAFYNLDDFANEYFNDIEVQYLELINLTQNVKSKPKVLIGLPYKDTWYIPGGNSYMAKLINDAGGEYIWKENESRESLPLDIERIFAVAQKANVWINTGSINNKNEILTIDERFIRFEPYSKGKIFNRKSKSFFKNQRYFRFTCYKAFTY